MTAGDSKRGFHATWWSIELPPNWNASEEGQCVSFSADPRIGILQVSATRKPSGAVRLDDVYEFAKDGSIENKSLLPCSLLNESGLFAEYETGCSIVSEWWLMSGPILVLVTYAVSTEMKVVESVETQRIVASLKISG